MKSSATEIGKVGETVAEPDQVRSPHGRTFSRPNLLTTLVQSIMVWVLYRGTMYLPL